MAKQIAYQQSKAIADSGSDDFDMTYTTGGICSNEAIGILNQIDALSTEEEAEVAKNKQQKAETLHEQ